ncbi:MAG: extracellular solute-binding protein [Ignavibacteriaceae bacterium]|nr:extracellular solute-binding protein [Ignavibacteriaceae bacterium]
MAENWNKNNKDVSVKFQPVPEGQSSEEIILAAVVGNTTPDIYSNMWQGDVEAYAQAGVLVALDTLKDFMDFITERCDSEVIEEIKSLDGHIYQIPWKINPIMLIYNEKIISDLGLSKLPETYSDFFKASAKFQKDTDGDGYIDRWFGYSEVLVTWWQRFFDFYPLYLASSGGAPLVKDNKAVFNNEHAVGVFKFLRMLYKNNYFSMERLSARQDVFLASVIATRFTGPWEISHADKYKPKGFEYNFTSLPVPDDHKGPIYTYGDPKNIVIFKTCKNPQTAWEYIKTLIDLDGDLHLMKITNQLPRRKNINTEAYFGDYFDQNPKMKVFANQSRYVRGTDASPVLKEVFDLISQEYEACVIYGIKTPEQAVKDASDAVNLLFLK